MLCCLLLHEQGDDVGQDHNERQTDDKELHGVTERQRKFLIGRDLQVVFQAQKLRRASAAAHERVPQHEGKRDHCEQ